MPRKRMIGVLKSSGWGETIMVHGSAVVANGSRSTLGGVRGAVSRRAANQRSFIMLLIRDGSRAAGREEKRVRMGASYERSGLDGHAA